MKSRAKRSARKERSDSPEIIDLDDSSKTSKDEDIQMVETNGKSGENSGSESAESSSNNKVRGRKSTRKRENNIKAEVIEDQDSEPDIIEEVISDDKNGDDGSDDIDDDDSDNAVPVVGLAANRSRRSTAGTNSKRDSIETKVASKTKESTPAVTDDEASSEVSFVAVVEVIIL